MDLPMMKVLILFIIHVNIYDIIGLTKKMLRKKKLKLFA
jgi:hypothetical protein